MPVSESQKLAEKIERILMDPRNIALLAQSIELLGQMEWKDNGLT